ncbi:MAG TPA: aminopeptidase P family protein, partial [Chlamydiales bacterium]|nr:aminopeptidase P family protein [Chlamydiales bacterium]
FVDGRYTEAAQKIAKVPIRDREVEVIKPLLPKNICFDQDTISYGRFLDLGKSYGNKFQPVSSPVSSLRLIKDPVEIKAMQKSARLLWKGFQYLVGALKAGMTEWEAMLTLERYVKSKGATGFSFEPIIAFGANTAMPHYHTGHAKLKSSDIVLIDIGVVVDGYCSDMTRTFFFKKSHSELVLILETTRQAHQAALKVCKPGVKLADLDLAARAVMKQAGLEDYFVHSLGHGIGLEVHEAPRLSSKGADKNLKLQPGMVVTIEPGLYVPNLGGARWEDTIAVTAKGCQNFYPQSMDFCSKISIK